MMKNLMGVYTGDKHSLLRPLQLFICSAQLYYLAVVCEAANGGNIESDEVQHRL